MTVANETYREQYNGNDVLVIFAVGFYFLEDIHLAVYLLDEVTAIETLQVLNTDYTVQDAGNPAGGTITFAVAPTSDDIVTIIRAVDLKQETDYVENDPFPADSHERALDKLTMQVQQLQEQYDRTVKAAVSSSFAITLPPPDQGKALQWNATEDDLENSQLVLDDFHQDVIDTAAEAVAAAASAAAALASEIAAATSETNAATSETNAQAWAEAAVGADPPGVSVASSKAWADTDEDVEVVTGGSVYSAKHWAIKAAAAAIPQNWIDGFITRPESGAPLDDIEIDPGQAQNNDNTSAILLTSALIKQMDANWMEGNNQGGFPSGLAIAIDTWYHLFVLRNPTNGNVDAGWDDVLTPTNLLADATGFTQYRRIASTFTDGSSQIIPYTQFADEFLWDDPFTAFSGGGSTGGALLTIATPPDVKTFAKLSSFLADGSAATVPQCYALLTSPDSSNIAASLSDFTLASQLFGAAYRWDNSVDSLIRTDTSSQIRHRVNRSATLTILLKGYIDIRGRHNG